MASSGKRQESLLANTQKKQIYPLMRSANSTQTMWVSQNAAALVSPSNFQFILRGGNQRDTCFNYQLFPPFENEQLNHKRRKYVQIILQEEPKVFPHWSVFFWSLTAFKENICYSIAWKFQLTWKEIYRSLAYGG